MKVLAAHTTVGNMDDARRLANAVITAKLAACAQLNTIHSIYRWKDEIQNEPEVEVVFKTTDEAYLQLERFIREHHPYETPEIYAIELHFVHAPYADWVAENILPPTPQNDA